jgi:hypothetical protein
MTARDKVSGIEAEFWDCTDPEVLTHKDPISALEACVEDHLEKGRPVEDVIREMGGISVQAYRKRLHTPGEILEAAERALDAVTEALDDEEHGHPEGDQPMFSVDVLAKHLPAFEAAVIALLAEGKIWQCEVVQTVELTPDETIEIPAARAARVVRRAGAGGRCSARGARLTSAGVAAVPLEDRAVCVTCGVGVSFDEDGCCSHCGNEVARLGDFRALLERGGLGLVPAGPPDLRREELIKAWALRELEALPRGPWREWIRMGTAPASLQLALEGLPESVAALVIEHVADELGDCECCRRRAPCRHLSDRSESGERDWRCAWGCSPPDAPPADMLQRWARECGL